MFKKKCNLLTIILLALMVFVTACGDGTTDQPVDGGHTHDYIDGVCECGEEHTHTYVDDLCKCGSTSFFERVMNYVKGFVPNTVEDGNLRLPANYGSNDVVITYKSFSPEYVTDAGERVDHVYDAEAIIQCTLQKDGKSYSEKFTFTSQGISYNERLERAKTYIEEFLSNTKLEEGTILPTELPEFGGQIRWLAEDPTLIYDYKTLHLPKEAKTVRLLAEIIFPRSTYEVVTHAVELDARPTNITDLDYVIEFLKTVLAEGYDYMCLYDGSLAEINRDYIINTDDELASELYTYLTRPDVSQSRLDQLVYPGYTMPNDDNVLWVVVHDTGLKTAGIDAEHLTKGQYNSAYSGASRDASWTYTVDDYTIYQSYEDTVTLWHATDGKSEGGGNLNGIGIEMCVNCDGNFEACMYNDARLIGHLLKTYSLGMLNMKQHYDFYSNKNCPQVIRDSDRWFEFLTLVEWEYISQTILSEYEISYEISSEEVTTWPIDGLYDLTALEVGEAFTITVNVNGTTFQVETIKR